MTKYKALMSIVVIAVVAVATTIWSPLVADARSATPEGDSGKIPALAPATYLDVADADECVAIPETFSISTGAYDSEANAVVGKLDVRNVDNDGTPEFHVIWWWCYVEVCKWIYTPDKGWHKVCYDKKQKCYFEHPHPHD